MTWGSTRSRDSLIHGAGTERRSCPDPKTASTHLEPIRGDFSSHFHLPLSESHPFPDSSLPTEKEDEPEAQKARPSSKSS